MTNDEFPHRNKKKRDEIEKNVIYSRNTEGKWQSEKKGVNFANVMRRKRTTNTTNGK